MKGIFNLNSPFSRFMGVVGDLIILNLIFIISCIPVVTIGAALTAEFYAINRLLAKDGKSVYSNYLKSFKENFKQATILYLFLLFLGVVFGAWFIVIRIYLSGTMKIIIEAIFYVILVRFVIIIPWVFQLQAKFENPILTTLRNAFLMSLRHFLTTFMTFLIVALMLIISVFYPVFVGYGLVWFLFGFSGIGYLITILYNRVFEKYIEKIIVKDVV